MSIAGDAGMMLGGRIQRPTAMPQEARGFHAKDGLHFARIDSNKLGTAQVGTDIPGMMGGVRIQWGERIVELDASEWASVVASVSGLGENLTTWGMLKALQRGEYGA